MPNFAPVILDAYEEILVRQADAGGLAHYNRLMNQGMSEAEMREELLRSPEYAVKNPDPGISNRLGLNVHIPSNAMLDDVALNVGMQWIRVDFDWYRVEPERGRYVWKEHDRVIERSHELGVGVLGTLAYTPNWASSNPGNPKITDPPASTEYWTNFVHEATGRYRDQVRYWQMWNEPNLTNFWTGSMTQYRQQILEAGARVAKEAHPDCLVVAPGLANIGEWRAWFEEAMNAKGFIDVINHHNYQSEGREVIESLERDGPFRPSLKTLIEDNEVDDRPFWITETGRRSDEGDQRRYYEEVVASLRESDWVQSVYFFHYWDGPGQGDGGFGIVNEGFSPKASYRFLQSVLRPLGVRDRPSEETVRV
jgi:hypothetical protein